MIDVAKLAEVSLSTVSRVIAGSDKISKETTERVLDAMKVLNYHPNAVAKSLATKMRTKIIGLLFPADTYTVFHNQFYIDILIGISTCAQKYNYNIMNAYEEEGNNYKTIQKMIKSGWVDGIILTTVREEDENLRYLNTRNIPNVVIGTPRLLGNTLWIDNDNEQAMYNITKHLIKKGHSKIAFISGSMEYLFNENRYLGYKRALIENNLDFDGSLVCMTTATFEGGYNAMTELINNILFDCVVTTDDVIAFGAIDAMNKSNKKYAISGFNNTPMCEYVNPKLTSVDILAEKLGYEACLLLINKLENKLTSTHSKIETKIVERSSTK